MVQERRYSSTLAMLHLCCPNPIEMNFPFLRFTLAQYFQKNYKGSQRRCIRFYICLQCDHCWPIAKWRWCILHKIWVRSSSSSNLMRVETKSKFHIRVPVFMKNWNSPKFVCMHAFKNACVTNVLYDLTCSEYPCIKEEEPQLCGHIVWFARHSRAGSGLTTVLVRSLSSWT